MRKICCEKTFMRRLMCIKLIRPTHRIMQDEALHDATLQRNLDALYVGMGRNARGLSKLVMRFFHSFFLMTCSQV